MKGVIPILLISSLFLFLAVSLISASTESDFLSLINKERASLNKPLLSINANLSQAAYLHSKEMAENNYFAHESLDDTLFSNRIKASGYNYISVAENIAYSWGPEDANHVFDMWKNSPGHYANMISNSYEDVGLGIYSKDGLTYCTLDFGKGNNIIVAPKPVKQIKTIPTRITTPKPIIRYSILSLSQKK